MSPHGFVDFGSVVAILGRQSHDGLVYFGRDGRHVRERLVGPFPPLVESIFHRSEPALALDEDQLRSVLALQACRSREVPASQGNHAIKPAEYSAEACGINRQPRAKCEPE
jgi:hypothetical protein